MTGELIIRAESSQCVSVHVALEKIGLFDRAFLLKNFAQALDMDVEDIAIATTLFPYLEHISTTEDIKPTEKTECKCDCEKQDDESEIKEDLGNGHTITIKVN